MMSKHERGRAPVSLPVLPLQTLTLPGVVADAEEAQPDQRISKKSPAHASLTFHQHIMTPSEAVTTSTNFRISPSRASFHPGHGIAIGWRTSASVKR